MKQIRAYLLSLTSLMTLLFASAEVLAGSPEKRILMIVSGYGQEQGKEAPGYEFDEFSKAYLVFKQNGLAVDVASPQGGPVEADKYNPEKSYNKLILNDKAVMQKLENTLSTASVNAADYDGLFVVGGKGAMFDLPKDIALQKLIANIYQQQGTVAAVCHGPAALVDVKLNDGSYLVAEKTVNSFTNEEEQLFGKKWMPKFEFMLEDKLVERGGKFQSSEIMLNHVAVDERLITGQNPASTVAVATELVKSLGIEPVEGQQHKDDRTFALVADLLSGKEGAAEALAKSPEQYQIEMVGMYGYYYLNIAQSDKELHSALRLMTLAKEAINNPRLDMKIAQTQHKLGDSIAASETLKQILAGNPDFEPAQSMLKTLAL